MTDPPPPSITDLTRAFARIGCLSFGGPAAQIALMQQDLVERRGWLDEATFLRALSFCMLLPGPEAMQLATYAGWRLRGIAGGLIAGGLFVAPGAVVIAALALCYVHLGDVAGVGAAFVGVQAAVIVIVAQALLRLSRRALGSAERRVIAGVAFAAIFALGLPFPALIAGAALYGAATARPGQTVPPRSLPPPWGVVAICTLLWLAPIAGLWLAGATFLTELALFFAKLATVSFGGAYAVLAYMTQTVVAEHGWITAAQMLDALGLAETTPGPLILVTQFVGMIAGFAEGGTWLALAAGITTLWVTFAPCFVWIFAGAPSIDGVAQWPRVAGALSAITAAIVGVMANLSVWFAAHVLFDHVPTIGLGPVSLIAPAPASFDLRAALLCAGAAIALIPLRCPLPLVLALSALAGFGVDRVL